MNIYSNRARFVLVGDMNASLTRDIPTSRDLVFRKFCESQCLSMGDNYPIQDTFQHASGNSSSQIDYILCSAGESLTLIQDISILTCDRSKMFLSHAACLKYRSSGRLMIATKLGRRYVWRSLTVTGTERM